MRLLSVFVFALCAPAIAQTVIPVPGFVTTYINPAETRGFWFQSPGPIVITTLNVPDESSQGIQNVEVIRLPFAPPPAYPATITGTQLFYAANAPAGTPLVVNIPVATNDVIGVLGACGTTQMANSYGARGRFASTILGMPVNLERLLTQTNLNASGGNQPVSRESSGAIARVEVGYVPAVGLFPDFAPDVTSGVGPLTVNFTDTSLTSDPGGIVAWSWDFENDGTPDSTLQNPSHRFAACGLYDVSLTVTDALHGPVTVVKTALINACSYGTFAPGCAGSNGAVTTLTGIGTPRINSRFRVVLNNLPISAAFMAFGLNNRTYNGTPLPLSLTQFGMPGCRGHINPEATSLVLGSGGTATWDLNIPNVQAFIGAEFYTQALVADPGFNPLGAVMSDAAWGVVLR